MPTASACTIPPHSLQERPDPTTLRDARREFDSLEKWLYCEDATALGLRGIELGQELRGRELMRLLLQAHVEHRGDGDVGTAIGVVQQQNVPTITRYTHKRMHVRNIITIFGKVRIRRVGYGMVGKDSIHPLDEQLRLPARRREAPLRWKP